MALFDSNNTEAATDGAAMSLRVDAAQTIGCAGSPQGKVCVDANQKFDVIVVVDGIPLTNGYFLAQAWIDYDNQGLVSKSNTTTLWADCDLAHFLTLEDVPNNGASAFCVTSLIQPAPPSFHKGDLFSFSLTCTATQSSSQITIIPNGVAPAGTGGARLVEAGASGTEHIPAVTGLTVNCLGPTRTPTTTLTPTITPTPTDTPTRTPTNTPTPKQPDGDGDGDTIPNSIDLDDDNDGCTDVQENGSDEFLGGLRNPHNPWDFYDVLGPGAALPLDKRIDLPNDILGVILRFSPQGFPPYDVGFDRGPQAGSHFWDLTPPDGVIDLPNDILGVIRQFDHSCE